jgi:hypothetical protein
MVIFGLLLVLLQFRSVVYTLLLSIYFILICFFFQEMAGPKIPWRPGRIDGFAAQATPDGRLPDATQGADHLRNIFYRMGYVATYKNFQSLIN